jgi:hypothetical protein
MSCRSGVHGVWECWPSGKVRGPPRFPADPGGLASFDRTEVCGAAIGCSESTPGRSRPGGLGPRAYRGPGTARGALVLDARLLAPESERDGALGPGRRLGSAPRSRGQCLQHRGEHDQRAAPPDPRLGQHRRCAGVDALCLRLEPTARAQAGVDWIDQRPRDPRERCREWDPVVPAPGTPRGLPGQRRTHLPDLLPESHPRVHREPIQQQHVRLASAGDDRPGPAELAACQLHGSRSPTSARPTRLVRGR